MTSNNSQINTLQRSVTLARTAAILFGLATIMFAVSAFTTTPWLFLATALFGFATIAMIFQASYTKRELQTEKLHNKA